MTTKWHKRLQDRVKNTKNGTKTIVKRRKMTTKWVTKTFTERITVLDSRSYVEGGQEVAVSQRHHTLNKLSVVHCCYPLHPLHANMDHTRAQTSWSPPNGGLQYTSHFSLMISGRTSGKIKAQSTSLIFVSMIRRWWNVCSDWSIWQHADKCKLEPHEGCSFPLFLCVWLAFL